MKYKPYRTKHLIEHSDVSPILYDSSFDLKNVNLSIFFILANTVYESREFSVFMLLLLLLLSFCLLLLLLLFVCFVPSAILEYIPELRHCKTPEFDILICSVITLN